MKSTLLIAMLTLAFAMLIGSATVTAAEMKADAAMASEAIAKAEAARKKAASVNGEWRDTGKFIKNAKKAAEAGDYDQAVKLAKKAEDEGNMGYQQAVSQSELRIPSYFKY